MNIQIIFKGISYNIIFFLYINKNIIIEYAIWDQDWKNSYKHSLIYFFRRSNIHNSNNDWNDCNYIMGRI